MYFEKKIYNILNEADEFKAKSKETGKVVVFKSKDAMDAAVKGGSHEPLDKPAGGSADKPKGQSVFAKPSGDDGKSSEPKAGGGDSGSTERDSVRLGMMLSRAVRDNQLPDGTMASTKLEDIDEDQLEDFYNEFSYDIAEEYDITQEIFANDQMVHLDDIAERGGTIADMYFSVIDSAEEYAAEEGTRKFNENKKSKKQPFRENYNRLFKGRSVL